VSQCLRLIFQRFNAEIFTLQTPNGDYRYRDDGPRMSLDRKTNLSSMKEKCKSSSILNIFLAIIRTSRLAAVCCRQIAVLLQHSYSGYRRFPLSIMHYVELKYNCVT
jgi:hypothetical protein